jgi:beta-ketodecanoyl-[acyl-carrier-protein] synthase
MQPSFPAVVISGTGLYRPPHVITNAELVEAFNRYADLQNEQHAEAIAAGQRAALTHSSVEFIEKASGIKQRYVIEKEGVLDPTRMYPRFTPRGDDEISLMAEIAVDAAQKALAQAGKTGADIDAVLCSSANMQRAYPAMAVEIQQALGAGGYGFDMNVACSSATFALEQAFNAVRSGASKCVLVVNPEITSAHLEWRDRDCHFIFGDVCTALIVERADTATGPDQWEILGTQLATQFSSNIRNNFGFMNRFDESGIGAPDKLFKQQGRKVFKDVCPMAAQMIKDSIDRAGLKVEQMSRFWLHQANLSMNQLISRTILGRDAEPLEAPVILDTYANTSSAGSIIAFHKHQDDLPSGAYGVICSFGAGYSIGSVVVRKA